LSNLPPLVKYASWQEYQEHYKKQLCRAKILTSDGIRVHFGEQKFWHAFCERDKKGKKDKFSFDRASYIDWIRPTLEQSGATLWQGWNKDKQIHEAHRRVSVVYRGFIVVIELTLKQGKNLKANFITAFYDKKGDAVAKIQKAPLWTAEECIKYLLDGKKGDKK